MANLHARHETIVNHDLFQNSVWLSARRGTVRDIVGFYMNSPDKTIELCANEKAPIQALDGSTPLLSICLG